jgi:2TM domain
VARVCAARRRADIARAFESLPRRRGVRRRVQKAALRTHAAAYATVNGSLVGVWALTGEGRFWPAQSLLPWGVVLGWHLYAYRRWTRPRRPRLAR